SARTWADSTATRLPPSSPTRRSSDLRHEPKRRRGRAACAAGSGRTPPGECRGAVRARGIVDVQPVTRTRCIAWTGAALAAAVARSEEHTSELQSRENLVWPLLLEKTR